MEAKYFEKDYIKYYVDGKIVVLDYFDKEKEVAEWLESTFGGELYMLPRVNKPDGIMTSDYLFNGEYWGLKEIKKIDPQPNGRGPISLVRLYDKIENMLNLY